MTQMLSADDIAARLAMPPSLFWKLYREGVIPRATVQLGRSVLRWDENVIETWIKKEEQKNGTTRGNT
jgi:predicted DNA-binding transcriptional regulator AlpA